MRIPFPVRIPWLYATTFAFLLLILQLVTGTELVFSLLCFFFVLTTALAFNVAGGMSRPSGSYILFFALLSAIVGLVTKVFFLEPGDSRLRVPIPLMETYLAGMVGMLVAAYLSRRVSRRRGFLEGFLTEANMRSAVIGCVIAGVALAVLGQVVTRGQTTTIFSPLLSALGQLDRFLEMGIILGVTYEVRRSHGTRTLNLPVVIAWAVIFFEGVILGYSKEALFSPFVSWLAAAAVLGYRFKPYQLVCAALLFLFFYVYMVPYCQIGRIYRSTTNTFSQNLAVSEDLLMHLGDVKRLMTLRSGRICRKTPSMPDRECELHHRFRTVLIDRLQMLSIDDSAARRNRAERSHRDLRLSRPTVLNAIPRCHLERRNRIFSPQISTAMNLAFLLLKMTRTSVSVSPIGEAYRVAKWGGVVVMLPIRLVHCFSLWSTRFAEIRGSLHGPFL